MKKLHLYKIYTPRDISKFILRKEEDIIALLEKRMTNSVCDISKFHLSPKPIGKKMMGYWYIRGREVIKIQKLMKEVKKDVEVKASGPVVGRANGKRIKRT